MIKEAIKKVVDSVSLSEAEATQVMNEIMVGEATSAQIACFATAVRLKGETVDEITGFVRAMRKHCIQVHPQAPDLVDTCGTGGDKALTINISTTAAFVAAGAGVHIAKHGNRSATRMSGSADVLQALGVNLVLPPEAVARCIDEIHIGFMFAPALHPAMKHAAGPRKEIGIATVFNVLGPLTNPAGANRQVMGVFDPKTTNKLANVLLKLGADRAMVFNGLDGMDELSTVGETKVSELRDGEVKDYIVTPEQFGLRRADITELAPDSDDPKGNASALLSILSGEKGARRDIVLLNAAGAIVVGGLADDLQSGLEIAAKSLDSGAALKSLKDLIKISNEYSQ